MRRPERSLLLPILLLCLLATGCGGSDDGGPADPLAAPAGRLILTPDHGDQGIAWGRSDCDTCHALTALHAEAGNTLRELVREKGMASCAGCHGPNGTDAPRRCLLCHNPADLPDRPRGGGPHAHRFAAGETGELEDGHCVVCHQSSDMDGRYEIDVDLTRFPDAAGTWAPYAVGAEFCLRCHNRDHQQPGFEITGRAWDDPLIALEEDYHLLDYHGWRDGSTEGTFTGLRPGYRYAELVECADCHAMHGTANPKLIIDDSRKGAWRLEPEFRALGWPVTVGEGGDYDQLCVLCHAMEREMEAGGVETGNGLAGVHRVGEDCRPCHTHGEATQAGL